MFVLFDDAGKFLTGRVLSETEASMQIELESGRRVKAKAANVLLRFEKPSPAELLTQAQSTSSGIELDMAWEFAPEDEFGFADLAREYFSAHAPLVEQVAMLLRLHESPHYFRRAGKGKYKKASADVIRQALAAIEKKQAIAAQIKQWADELSAGSCPEPISQQLYKILFKPDKNAPEYKAVVEASRASHTAPLDLLQKAGAIASPYEFHWKRFLLENFPKGIAFPELTAPAITGDLPLSEARAFSIDDSHTTEIDDALSVQGLGSGLVTVGVHIAAPGLAIQPVSAIDALARTRMSTVYMPGYKITMLPDDVVQTYTLQEGRDCPAVSLYVVLDEATLDIRSSETRIERVHISNNLRHDQLDSVVTESWLQGSNAQAENTPDFVAAIHPQLAFLHRLALNLKARREVVRGKPETFNRPDYTFRLQGNGVNVPDGSETVSIGLRQRGAPLDLIVAEAMILANSSWGNWMAELGVPAIYRSQASLAPGMKVRMSTKALPHAGIGVKSYAWSSSPLRRYVDLVNQWQIIACARHGKTAALAAPFKPKDAELFSIISAFDAAYTAYNGFQNSMERFWTLCYVQQNELGDITANVIKDNLVRADDIPLVLPVAGAQGLPRGTRVRVRLGDIDLITLDIHGTVIERLDESAATTMPDIDDESDEEEIAGPIAIAVDVNEAEAIDNPSGDNPSP